MHVEVDQSGKIGQTNVDTVLAFSNGVNFSVLIPRRVKQECLRELRRRRIAAQDIYLRLFSVGLFFLLKDHIAQIEFVIVDMEYPGKELLIKQRLYNLFHRNGQTIERRQIAFGYVGKKARCHEIGLAIYRGERVAARTLTTKEILDQF